MNPVEGLIYGLGHAMSPALILAAFIGALLGTLIGVLPGLGPVAGAAIVLPITFHYQPVIGLIMIAGIYLGAQFGGSTTSVLLNIPGDDSAIVATFDGHEMAKKGRAGAALSIMAVGSWIAGTIALVLLVAMAPLLANVALKFGPVEFFALTAGGLLALARISGGSLAGGLFPMIIGIMMSTVGTSISASYNRFTFGDVNAALGFSLVSVSIGMYGISELVYMLEDHKPDRKPMKVRLKELLPTREEWHRAVPPWMRGSFIGFVFGLLPVPSATLSTFTSYRVEKAVSKHRAEIGSGAVEGIAGPEAANNSAAAGKLIPTLVLGLPFSATLALMLSAMLVQGIQPGPLLVTQHPEIFWGVIGAMYVANIMLLVLNLPMVSIWVSILRIPHYFLIPTIIVIGVIGSYSVRNNMFDVYVVLVTGVIGYFLRKLDFALASLLVGLVLGPQIEKYFTQAMFIGGGKAGYFVSTPVSAAMWVVVGLVVIAGVSRPIVRHLRKRGTSQRSDETVDAQMMDASHDGRG